MTSVEADLNPAEIVEEYCDNRGYRVESLYYDAESKVVRVVADDLWNKFNGDRLFGSSEEDFKYYVRESNLKYIEKSVGLNRTDADISISGMKKSKYGTKLKLHSDYEDKELIKSLDWEETHRSWDSFHSCWVVDADALEQVYEVLGAERKVWVDPLLWKRYDNNWSE